MEIATHPRETPSRAQEILIEEVERLMDDVAPNEAETAALYVETPESFLGRGSDERAFGIPGAGFATLVGPVLVSFVVMVARSTFEQLVKKGTETAADSLLTRLLRVFRLAPAPGTDSKERTLATIALALIDAGWDAGRAVETAEKVWHSGVTAGQRLTAVD